jgi:NMD protein affecting ribosome stability and mRNA decay
MFEMAEPLESDDFVDLDDVEEPPVRSELIEPPIRAELIEPPIRRELPPPSKQEIEAAAADELLKIAAEEEKDLQKIRKAQQSKDSFTVYCSKGCRIRVKVQHRGRVGKCPRCQAEFIVPKDIGRKSNDKTAPADDET